MDPSPVTTKIAVVLPPSRDGRGDLLPPTPRQYILLPQEEDKQLTESDRVHIQSILTYWFGPADNHWSPQYQLPTRVWFSGTPAVDSHIKEHFEPLLLEVESTLKSDSLLEPHILSRWMTSPAGRLCLILLMDQFSRNIYRGSSRMFAFDTLALEIALAVLDDPQHVTMYSPPQKLFLYYCLEHAEDRAFVTRSVELFGELAERYPAERRYSTQHRSAKQHLDMIEAFGRYPHRNQLLGRESTSEEREFLASHRFAFMRSVQERGPDQASQHGATNNPKFKKARDNGPKTRPMKILALHGFRQNAHIIRRALRPLERQLEGHAAFTYLNAPHAYTVGSTPDGVTGVEHPTWKQAMNHQRQWYSASDDGKVYGGMDVTMRYIDQAFKEERFDGIIGFSQGATLIGLLAALQPHNNISFRFGICISGFPSRADAHRDLTRPNTIQNTATLHIYGLQDEHLGTPVEMEAKTRALAALFADGTGVTISHSGGHFTPAKWPVDRMAKFVMAQAIVDSDFDIDRETEFQGLEAKLAVSVEHYRKRASAVVRTGSQKPKVPELVMYPIGMSASMRTVVARHEAFHGLVEYPPVVRAEMFEDEAVITRFIEDAKSSSGRNARAVVDDLVLVAFATRTRFQDEEPTELFFRVWMRIYLAFQPELVMGTLQFITTYGSWKELGKLAVLNRKIHEDEFAIDKVGTDKCDVLHRAIVAAFVAQLTKDRTLVDSFEHDDAMHHTTEGELLYPSTCALGVPRIRSGVDKRCRLAKEVALLLYPLAEVNPAVRDDKLRKQICYSAFTKLVSRLCRLLDRTSARYYNRQLELNRRKDRSAFFSEVERKEMLAAPPSDWILNPEPMPIVPCLLEELDPLLRYMGDAGTLPTDKNVTFMIGTITPDGRLDMCKQAVGPGGITPLLNAMKNSHIRRLLLGNNIVGDVGAEQIAQYMRDPDSKLDTWYIAGNNFGADAIAVICDALAFNTKVKSLWFKRNPLKPAGAIPIARMLETNTTLETLDVLNTGILDEGVETIFNALKRNKTLRNIYIDSNGLTIHSATVLRHHLEPGTSNLRCLYLSCCRLGDEGIIELSRGLANDTKLTHLGLGSNCIGPTGCRHLVDALRNHPALQFVTLGFTRATLLLGGLSNFIGEEGALYIAQEWLPGNSVLRAIDLAHNGIPVAGIQALRDALRDHNQTITSLKIAQFGQMQNPRLKVEIDALLNRNRRGWGKCIVEAQGGMKGIEDQDETEQMWLRIGTKAALEVEIPPWADEIMSVYRTK
ncbi:hypothetical protein BC938DRAFT_472954 [Jimgerdemannia flammicorona]|uniref:Serine hydrolase domain-containing protein n=1 Tax=Jimgerdemannia flammicorona TaxID=994334 RepID=A0A433QTL8_9FUNG|nr:hypothetical protein BC938DRAFT_472954 [Jimgerdemannia flammicorona]